MARVVPLDSREAGTPPCPDAIPERLALAARLSQEAWALSGRPIPQYTRRTMPMALRRLSDQGAD
jgi:hypothetical protein